MTFTDPVEVILKRKGFSVHSVSPDATVYDALRTMAAEDIGALVVLEGARAVGIFSERDYARKVVLKDPMVSRRPRHPPDHVHPRPDREL